MGSSDITVNENVSSTIACYVDSNPGSAITLLKDGILIKKTWGSHELESTLRNYCNDSGVYTCTSVNDYNTDGASIKNIYYNVQCKLY
ncbi:hypothetical protein DPMN_076022 [Dreissena polymorpha]|uniref:Ig-like domain-containing protein n=1 Tax=Dreissena polymorpha TaxID=45954 RepID=A0A9D3YI21_DREPO|nr:hypothetical protein DPMN_076022 [Dreissena polymorpha]